MQRPRPSAAATGRALLLLIAAACVVLPRPAAGQGLTGALIGTVSDEQGAALAGALVRITSPALIGGEVTTTTNEWGQLRFPSLPSGQYVLSIELPGFRSYREAEIRIVAGGTIDRPTVLTLAGLAESIVVEGRGSRIDARNPGFATRFGPEDLRAIPTRRASMYDFIRAAPGVSPTSPGSGGTSQTMTVSAFGSGTNENQFLIDGTNFTCPCNGVARSEPGVDFIQEIQVQSVGASVEFGNVQGAVINVITRQGGERFAYDASYYAQTAALTSQPVRLPIARSDRESGYERARYRDFSTNLGGPLVRDRVWFFAGYQYLRDYDSQPGSDPAAPRTYEQDKVIGKLTWKLAPRWQLVQTFHDEFWVSPEQPTSVKPFPATFRRTASVPAMTFGDLTHTSTGNTLWNVRAGRFVYSHEEAPGTGDWTIPGRSDSVSGVSSGAPPAVGDLTLIRTTTKATMSRFQPGLLGADHEWKIGGQIEKGEHHSGAVIPTGRRFVDVGSQPSEMISSPPSNIGGVFITAAAFATDAVTLGDRLTVNAGVRFDHSRAVSQDLPRVDQFLRDTDDIVSGRGTLFTWNLWSPRAGVTGKLTADGRTIMRASYGRFAQGVLTGEIQPFHPGATAITTTVFDPVTGDYTGTSRVVDPTLNLRLDPDIRAPHTDEFSIGVDRELGRRASVAIAYVRKDGTDFIGWRDIGGLYHEETRTLADGRSIPVQVLDNRTADRLFLLTNPAGYSLTYNGLVIVAEKRRSQGWQAFGSYTLSRAYGLQPSSGANAAGAQASTVAPPPFPVGVTFGRDPNDLTNARGRLPNDRPHIFRVMGSIDVPRTGFVIAANLQHFSGKPWTATALVPLPQTGNQPTQRILIEPRGSRRLSSQSLLDVRVSRSISLSGVGRIELLVDILNALNDTAEEALATDNLFSRTFAQPTTFIDPRRAMVSVRLNLGR
jgi:hypothetical protein